MAAPATTELATHAPLPAVYESYEAAQQAREERYQLYLRDEKTLRATVCKSATPDQFLQFCRVAADNQLNPYLKQIWYVEGIGVLTGRDSYIVCAQRRQDYEGFISQVVCENDDFEMDAATNTVIKHTYKGSRGAVLGAYAIGYRKGCKPAHFYAPFEQYNKPGNPAWKTYPFAMILTKAESNMMRRQFPIDGLFIADSREFDLEEREYKKAYIAQGDFDPYGDGRTNPEALTAPEGSPNASDPSAEALAKEEASPFDDDKEALGYKFATWPKGEWFDQAATEQQVKHIALQSKERGVPEDLRRYVAHAILQGVAAPSVDITEEEPYSTKKLNKGQASLVIDFLKKATDDSVSAATQSGQQIHDQYKEEAGL